MEVDGASQPEGDAAAAAPAAAAEGADQKVWALLVSVSSPVTFSY